MPDQIAAAATVTDVPERSRFEIAVDGEPAGFVDYRVRADRIELTHLEIDDAHQGQGLAAVLARTALEDIRDAGQLVIPSCPYVAGYIRKHPEYLDVVDSEHREAVS